jgi:hypothetical protein
MLLLSLLPRLALIALSLVEQAAMIGAHAVEWKLRVLPVQGKSGMGVSWEGSGGNVRICAFIEGNKMEQRDERVNADQEILTP